APATSHTAAQASSPGREPSPPGASPNTRPLDARSTDSRPADKRSMAVESQWETSGLGLPIHDSEELSPDAASANDEPSPHSTAAWTTLSTAALVRFVRDERPAVTAVVISQLPPSAAVEVLQQLPTAVSHEVLQRLSGMQEIDPEAMAAIDEHLAQRLGEYQHRVESELENSRRIRSLLDAAPPQLRQQWSQLLSPDGAESSSADGGSAAEPTQANAATSTTQKSTTKSAFPSAVDIVDFADFGPPSASMASGQFPAAPGVSPPEGPDILPFPQDAGQRARREFDRSMVQFEFEQILDLPPHTLAALLSATDSPTVLLALAGASPEFMHRFYRMLDRRDAQILRARLQKIGALQLREIDEAQQRIAEYAAHLLPPNSLTNGRAAQAAA
ncbi:MAG: hypothetical protein KDA45_05275, partial [Planctomycetales bacterium]|nr:hypothetical protein [Planctomycetales bacterium]